MLPPVFNPPLPLLVAHAEPGPSRILHAPAPLAFWHLASLDAPTVAIVWSVAFAWAVHVSLPRWLPILLGLATWAIYLLDRLLDARRALRTSADRRLGSCHRFHWRHRGILLPVTIAAICAAAAMVFLYMPTVILERNSVLAAATLAYFTGIHAPRRPSASNLAPPFRLRFSAFATEAPVGLLFVFGCILPVLNRAPSDLSLLMFSIAIPSLYFALLAWLNYYAINRWKLRRPSNRRFRIELRASLLAFTGLALALFLSSTYPRPAALIAAGACSAFMLAVLDKLRDRLSPLLLRSAADLVLLTPLALLLR